MPATGQRNTKLRDLLASDLQMRNDPSFAWSRAVSSHMFLPQIRGCWPFSSVNVVGNVADMTEQANFLIQAGTPGNGVYGFVPYGDLDGSSQYWITGADGTVAIANFTCGFWIRCNRATGTLEALFGNLAAGVGFVVQRLTTGVIRFTINAVSFDSTTLIVQDKWHHIVTEFAASTSMKAWLDGELIINGTASVPASVDGPTFYVGREAAGNYLDGQMTLGFFCHRALGDAMNQAIYHQSKPMFGK